MSLSTKTFVYLSVLLTTSVFAAGPNVVLIMADDLGWGDVGCYHDGSPIRTPHLEAMAAGGVRFERFYSASAVCSPTRASCLTGRHPERMGIVHANKGHLPAEERNLAGILAKAGYRTGHFGKWHLGTLTTGVKDSNRGGPQGKAHFAPPWERGFEVCFSTEAKVPTWDPLIRPKDAETSGTWWSPAGDRPAEAYGTRYWDEKGAEQKDNLEGDDSRVVMDRAVTFIRGAVTAKEPFLAVVWFHTPHLPVVTGGKYAEMYAGHGGHERSYYGCITAMDEQVGRLRALLRELGVAEDTMVWFCSDNGPEGNAKSPGQTAGLKGRKRDLYEGGVRVPGILEWPAGVGTSGRVVTAPAVTSDYLPTVLAAAGLEVPADRPLDGVDLLPVLRGERKERGAGIGFSFAGQDAWVTDDWKVIRPRKGKAWELYHLPEDPGERRDRAAEKPELVKELAARHAEWRASCRRSAQGADYRP